ncbi:neuroglian-like [Gigantopelta aegis]|uniref:neuroglian-like n=1 Tax=Gigantopelta aegis TaxID=1735272 RepID=UPI001B88DB72|nr:neuroglian-like [Gigantopelta aegis]
MTGWYTWVYLLYFVSYITASVYIENQLKNLVEDEGARAKFACKASLNPRDQHRLQVTWKHDGSILRNTSGKYTFKVDRNKYILNIHSVELTDAGVYSCRATVGADVDISSAHLTVRGVPDPPQEVQIISCHGHSAEIVWQPSGNNGAKISEFFIQFNTTDDPDSWHQYYESFRGNVQSAFIDLAPWGTYAFRIVAKNAVGISDPSSVTDRTCTPPPDRPDGNPKDVHTRTDKKGMLSIVWTPMHRLYHHGPGFRYHVYWRPRGSTYWDSAIVDEPSASSFEVEVDDVYGIYEVLVKAENDLGESHQPAFVYLGHSGEGEPVASPKDFRLDPTKPVQPHVAHFIWESVDEEVDNIRGRFIGYKLRYWKSSEGRLKKNEVDIIMQEQHSDWAPDVRVALPNLPAYTALRAQVAVMNSHYTGPPSQTIDFFTPEGAPGPVRELHVEATGMKYVLLKWLPPDEPNGVLTGYNIGYQEAINGSFGKFTPLSPRINNPSTLGARITGLETNHQYRFHVTARTKSAPGEPQYIDIKTASGKQQRNYYRLANDELQELYEPFAGAQQAQISLALLMLMNITWFLFR